LKLEDISQGKAGFLLRDPKTGYTVHKLHRVGKARRKNRKTKKKKKKACAYLEKQ
jgi:hypothetical protein